MNKDNRPSENNIHIKDWPEGDRPREMIGEFDRLNGLMATTSDDLLSKIPL